MKVLLWAAVAVLILILYCCCRAAAFADQNRPPLPYENNQVKDDGK